AIGCNPADCWPRFSRHRPRLSSHVVFTRFLPLCRAYDRAERDKPRALASTLRRANSGSPAIWTEQKSNANRAAESRSRVGSTIALGLPIEIAGPRLVLRLGP